MKPSPHRKRNNLTEYMSRIATVKRKKIHDLGKSKRERRKTKIEQFRLLPSVCYPRRHICVKIVCRRIKNTKEFFFLNFSFDFYQRTEKLIVNAIMPFHLEFSCFLSLFPFVWWQRNLFARDYSQLLCHQWWIKRQTKRLKTVLVRRATSLHSVVAFTSKYSHWTKRWRKSVLQTIIW